MSVFDNSEKFEEVLGAASQRFNRTRARTINYFSVIAQAAPMLELLGTVTGMILAFGSLSNSGGGEGSVRKWSVSKVGSEQRGN